MTDTIDNVDTTRGSLYFTNILLTCTLAGLAYNTWRFCSTHGNCEKGAPARSRIATNRRDPGCARNEVVLLSLLGVLVPISLVLGNRLGAGYSQNQIIASFVIAAGICTLCIVDIKSDEVNHKRFSSIVGVATAYTVTGNIWITLAVSAILGVLERFNWQTQYVFLPLAPAFLIVKNIRLLN